MSPYLGNMIDDFRALGKWKIQLTMKVKFMSSKKSSESQPMHSKSDNREIMIDADTGEIIGELFNYL